MRTLLLTMTLLAAVMAGCVKSEGSNEAPQTLADVDFTWSPEAPLPGDIVFFEPHFTGEADGIIWDFGDGDVMPFTNMTEELAVTHLYEDAGLYTVAMTLVRENYTTVEHVVRVGTVSSIDGPEIVVTGEQGTYSFGYNWTEVAENVAWEFGDGVVSSSHSPTHSYDAVGSYDVELTVLFNGTFYSATYALAVTEILPPVKFSLHYVGERGPEPSVGVTSSGCIFFAALEKVMRSCDGGETWAQMSSPFMSPTSNDPYLWVDPYTDRIFDVQMGPLTHTWVAWSDDDGETWMGNPYDQGPFPVVDHIKLGSGPWTSEGYGLAGTVTTNVYETATYFCYNKLVGVFCYTSFDGGMTFPIGGQVFGLTTTGAGLHGAISTAPDGTVYVTPRVATPTLLMSKDNGFSWEAKTMGGDVGTTSPRKNSEVAADVDSNGYHVWIGGDEGVYMSRSTDSGVTWEQESLRLSPEGITSATFPHISAGDPGRIGITYLGSENYAGSAQVAADDARYDLYYTYSTNALDEEPDFYTIKLTDDPVQIGSICLNSGACSGGNRNLLDFNDLHHDQEGRVYIAFADGCTGECAEDDNPIPGMSRDSTGVVAILQEGPSLYEDVGALGPLVEGAAIANEFDSALAPGECLELAPGNAVEEFWTVLSLKLARPVADWADLEDSDDLTVLELNCQIATFEGGSSYQLHAYARAEIGTEEGHGTEIGVLFAGLQQGITESTIFLVGLDACPPPVGECPRIVDDRVIHSTGAFAIGGLVSPIETEVTYPACAMIGDPILVAAVNPTWISAPAGSTFGYPWAEEGACAWAIIKD